MPIEMTPLLRYCLDDVGRALGSRFHGVFSRETVTRSSRMPRSSIGDRPTVEPVHAGDDRAVRARAAVGGRPGRRRGSRSSCRRCCSCASGTPGAARWPRPRASPVEGLDRGALGRARTRRGIDPAVVAGDDARSASTSAEEFPKPLTDVVVRAADVVVTMGCGDACPVYPGKRYQDWPVADPCRPVDRGRQADSPRHLSPRLRADRDDGAGRELARAASTDGGEP